MKSWISVWMSILLGIQLLAAQTNGDIYEQLSKAKEEGLSVRLELVSGSGYRGSIESLNTEEVTLNTADGVFTFSISKINEVIIIYPNRRSSGWYKNPADYRLFITQSGKMAEPKGIYYQNTYIFFSNFTIGIADNFSANLGFSTVPGIGIDNQLFNIGGKLQVFETNHIALSANGTYYTFPDESEGVGTLFGTATFTQDVFSATLGTGFAFGTEGSSDPLFIVGGQLRTSERFGLLTETLFIPDGAGEVYPLFFLGGRFIGRKTVFDLGFLTSNEFDALIPFLTASIKLN
ncbi:MAG: hypothetical protein AAFW89_04850 [Bacteroidota bacterium]